MKIHYGKKSLDRLEAAASEIGALALSHDQSKLISASISSTLGKLPFKFSGKERVNSYSEIPMAL